MHETSLVRDLLKQAEQAMLCNQVENVRSIHVEVGPLSGVDPLLVEQAFEALVPNTIFAKTRLVVEQPNLLAICRDCNQEFEVLNFQFRCPNCLSPKVQIISGDQLRLISISTIIDESRAFRIEECVHE